MYRNTKYLKQSWGEIWNEIEMEEKGNVLLVF